MQRTGSLHGWTSCWSKNQHYNEVYSTIGLKYLKHAQSLAGKGSSEDLYLKAWEYMRVRSIAPAIQTFQKLLCDYKLSEHEYAISTSSLSFMYKLDNKPAKTKEYLIKAS